MSILAYIESKNNKPKKSSFEVVSYAKELSKQLSLELVVVAINIDDSSDLNKYGPDKIITINDADLEKFDAKIYADIISQVCIKFSTSHIILSGGVDSKYLAPILSIKLEAGYVSNVVDLPSKLEPFSVKRTSFSNKSFCDTTITSDKKIISVSNNSFSPVENPSTPDLVDFQAEISERKMTQDSLDLAKGNVSIADADIVVSAGRGLKGPENWGIIEDLANTLGAATACSKPVSDLGWRPHSEHVGQTGKPVSTNLYIAIGISGAIQHLAGVSSSKVKVVINTDPEAPFFKAADYGIVGDAFEVVPKLNEKLKAFKAENN
jgi:electron transfer flavoprotein alpha subunit